MVVRVRPEWSVKVFGEMGMKMILVVCLVVVLSGCADTPRCIDRLVPINAATRARHLGRHVRDGAVHRSGVRAHGRAQ